MEKNKSIQDPYEETKRLLNELKKENKKFWLSRFSKHGYSTMEKDSNKDDWEETFPENPQLEGFAVAEQRIAEKLIFWKEKEIDGIIMADYEFKNEYNETSYSTRFYSIGPAYDYFNELYKNKKESLIKKLMRFGRKKELAMVCPDIIGRMNIKGKKYGVTWILSNKEFCNLL